MQAFVSPPAAQVSESFADRYLTLPGAVLRYRDQGQGPAVLFVHGWTLDLEMWQPQVPAFQETFRVVRFDRRAFGLSSGRAGLTHDISDIGALCRHLAIERVALVGMSQGARAVLGFASAFPDRVSCLILDGSPDCLRDGPAPDDPPLDHYRELVRTHGINAFRREWLTHPLATLVTSDPRPRELLAAMIARYPANDLMGVAAEGAAAGPQDTASIRAPVLVITGQHDVSSRIAAADALIRRLPCAQRAVIPAAGHLANLDNPMHYNAVVREFLERHAVEPS
jgi:pimeloyl-ACP methyl ester carboxylesterase